LLGQAETASKPHSMIQSQIQPKQISLSEFQRKYTTEINILRK